MNKTITFQVSVPTDNGFIGRACSNPDCEHYFKISADKIKNEMYCPYCGSKFDKSESHTTDQVKYLNRAVEAEAEAYIHNEFHKMLKKSFGSASARNSGISYKPGSFKKRRVTPDYQEREVDSELTCPCCSTSFQVYGIFGYCPGCREENMLVYDANLNIIKHEINISTNPERQLRHAYGDLVSTFENFCKRKARKVSTETLNFQVLFDARKFFRERAQTDILKNVPKEELLALRRVFQKRHLYIHSDGTVTEKYIQMIPEDKELLGKKAPLSIEELELAAVGMRVALMDLVKSIEDKG
jgi:Zn finger protein HypA/HybF involved in hydrogenase expression